MKALTLRLDDATYERLRRAAFDGRTTITALVRDAVAAREPVTQDDPWPTEPLCDHYSPPNRCAAAGCPHAPQPVTQDECSYCLHRPAVGMTVDEDSICDECAVPVPPPGEAAVRHVLGSYGVDDLDVVGFDNLVRDLLAARGDAGPRP
jgi:hypothetical protein